MRTLFHNSHSILSDNFKIRSDGMHLKLSFDRMSYFTYIIYFTSKISLSQYIDHAFLQIHRGCGWFRQVCLLLRSMCFSNWKLLFHCLYMIIVSIEKLKHRMELHIYENWEKKIVWWGEHYDMTLQMVCIVFLAKFGLSYFYFSA